MLIIRDYIRNVEYLEANDTAFKIGNVGILNTEKILRDINPY